MALRWPYDSMNEPRGKRTCGGCGDLFPSPRSRRKYCSPACRKAVSRGRISHRAKSWDDFPPPLLDEVSGCLRWQGSHNPRGYGRFGKGYAHREAWIRSGGTIPDGMVVDHVAARGCIYKDCINVTHLEVVTQWENVHRGFKCITQMEKTHCPKGHPYSGHNLLLKKDGKRNCRACGNERNMANYYKRKAKAAAH